MVLDHSPLFISFFCPIFQPESFLKLVLTLSKDDVLQVFELPEITDDSVCVCLCVCIGAGGREGRVHSFGKSI